MPLCVEVMCKRQGTGESFALRVSGSVRYSLESWSVTAMDLEDGGRLSVPGSVSCMCPAMAARALGPQVGWIPTR